LLHLNPAKHVICNTTLLSNFAVVHRVDLLIQVLATPLYTTAHVLDEISAGVSAGYTHLEALEQQLLAADSPFVLTPLESQELKTFREARLRLHAGEASCFAIALHRQFVFGTDDLAARKIVRANKVVVIGTVGVMVLCRRGVLPLADANQFLQQMIDAGYRSPVPRLDEFWKIG
jgi:predicted nucleic acid-binding protein